MVTTTKKATVLIDGQKIELPENLARDDALLKEALVLFVAGLGNVKIDREEKDGQLTVKVIKLAGTKGGHEYLATVPSTINPVLIMTALLKELERKNELSVEQLILLQPQIEKALELGMEEQTRLSKAFSILSKMQAQPAPLIPVGF
jgi:hypothetical protein